MHALTLTYHFNMLIESTLGYFPVYGVHAHERDRVYDQSIEMMRNLFFLLVKEARDPDDELPEKLTADQVIDGAAARGAGDGRYLHMEDFYRIIFVDQEFYKLEFYDDVVYDGDVFRFKDNDQLCIGVVGEGCAGGLFIDSKNQFEYDDDLVLELMQTRKRMVREFRIFEDVKMIAYTPCCH